MSNKGITLLAKMTCQNNIFHEREIDKSGPFTETCQVHRLHYRIALLPYQLPRPTYSCTRLPCLLVADRNSAGVANSLFWVHV